jgi:hypothetical protein
MAHGRGFLSRIVGVCEVGFLSVPVMCAEIIGLLAKLECDDLVHGREVAATAVFV